VADIISGVFWPAAATICGIIFSCGVYWALFKNLSDSVKKNTTVIDEHGESIVQLQSEIERVDSRCSQVATDCTDRFETLTKSLSSVSKSIESQNLLISKLLREERTYKPTVVSALKLVVAFIGTNGSFDVDNPLIVKLFDDSSRKLDALERLFNGDK